MHRRARLLSWPLQGTSADDGALRECGVYAYGGSTAVSGVSRLAGSRPQHAARWSLSALSAGGRRDLGGAKPAHNLRRCTTSRPRGHVYLTSGQNSVTILQVHWRHISGCLPSPAALEYLVMIMAASPVRFARSPVRNAACPSGWCRLVHRRCPEKKSAAFGHRNPMIPAAL